MERHGFRAQGSGFRAVDVLRGLRQEAAGGGGGGSGGWAQDRVWTGCSGLRTGCGLGAQGSGQGVDWEPSPAPKGEGVESQV